MEAEPVENEATQIPHRIAIKIKPGIAVGEFIIDPLPPITGAGIINGEIRNIPSGPFANPQDNDSFIFIADLVREIDLPVEVDFLEASSYGDRTESSREVRILKARLALIEEELSHLRGLLGTLAGRR